LWQLLHPLVSALARLLLQSGLFTKIESHRERIVSHFGTAVAPFYGKAKIISMDDAGGVLQNQLLHRM